MADIKERIDELVLLIQRNHLENGSVETSIPGLYFVRQNFKSAPKHFFHKPSICVIAQGKKDMCLNDKHYIYEPGDYLLSSVSLPLTGEVVAADKTKPYLSIKLELDLNVLVDMIADLNLKTKPCDTECGSIEVGKLSENLIDAIYRLCSLVEREDDAKFLAQAYKREVYYYLLKGDLGFLLSQFAVKGGNASQIREVIREITQNYNEPLSVEALAEKFHFSVPTLHRHFKHFTDMSPIQFQKMLRLQQARQLMLSGDFNVNSAAYEVGYESASQFSREYVRLFGNPPKEDIKRLRGIV